MIDFSKIPTPPLRKGEGFTLCELRKVGLRYAVLEVGVYLGVLNGMKDQIIQRKTVIRDREVSLNYYYYYHYYSFAIIIIIIIIILFLFLLG